MIPPLPLPLLTPILTLVAKSVSMVTYPELQCARYEELGSDTGHSDFATSVNSDTNVAEQGQTAANGTAFKSGIFAGYTYRREQLRTEQRAFVNRRPLSNGESRTMVAQLTHHTRLRSEDYANGYASRSGGRRR